jgi:hypothetical protein
MGYIETSALDTTNVEQAFLKILNEVYKININKNQDTSYTSLAVKIEAESSHLGSKIQLKGSEQAQTQSTPVNGCC